MKKLICIFLLILSLSLTSCSSEPPVQQKPNAEQTPVTVEPRISAVWLSCYELSTMFLDGTEESFINHVNNVVDSCLKYKINTLFLQVRPFCDAFYPSDIFPWSKYCIDKNGNYPDYDPLEIFLNLMHKNGIELHAWINPYRISFDPQYVPGKDFTDYSVSCSEGVYLNPSRVESQKTVLNGVREILEKYDIDGIHIDDYFYPVKDKKFDSIEYAAYRDSGGKMSLSDWRCNNVNSLVSSMYSLVHSISSDVVFSISPAADINKNEKSLYADVELWFENEGYADWIIPQIYFGFEHNLKPFERVASRWEKLADGSHVKLLCGLAAYKQGKTDSTAGTGSEEWVEKVDVIERQIDYLNNNSCWQGYALFSFSNIKLK